MKREEVIDRLERMLIDPDQLSQYMEVLQGESSVGKYSKLIQEAGEKLDEGRLKQVLEKGLEILTDYQLHWLMLNYDDLLTLRVAIEEDFQDHWLNVTGRLMDEYDRQEGIVRRSAREIIRDAWIKAGGNPDVMDS